MQQRKHVDIFMEKSPSAPRSRKRNPRALPLYTQVKELLIRDVVEGRWKAGAILPSEFDLADEFGVSQGTIRKALDELSDENIVFRRQGKGTFITKTTPQNSLFHYFHITRNDGLHAIPRSLTVSIDEIAAVAAVNQELQCEKEATLFFIQRIRFLENIRALFERIYLPCELFAGLARERQLPDALYNFYEREHGVTIHRAEDRIKAKAADKSIARHLEIPVATPVLAIERKAYRLDGRAVEYRISYCESSRYHYFVKLN